MRGPLNRGPLKIPTTTYPGLRRAGHGLQHAQALVAQRGAVLRACKNVCGYCDVCY